MRHPLILSLVFLALTTGCASPTQKAMKRAMKDYKRASADSTAYAHQQVHALRLAAQAFRATNHRWPETMPELAEFALLTGSAFDPGAFTSVNLASLSDGSLQIHYDVDCSRFDTAQYKFTQQGTVNLKPH